MNSHRTLLRICLAVWVGSTALAAQEVAKKAPAPVDSLPALQARLAEQVAQPRFAAAMWGIKIVSLDTGKTLFEHNAHKLLKPASNAKLYTGALALDRLGPDFRIQTSLYAAAKPDESGTLGGDLIIFGRGDPSFSARFHDGDYALALEPLAQALVKAGVKRIQGDLVGDESFFRGPPLGSGWTWDDLQYYYGAEVSALTAQDNVVDLLFQPGPKAGAPGRITPMPSVNYLTFINQTETVTNGGKLQIDLYRPLGGNVVQVTGTLPLGVTNHTDAVAVAQPARWFLALLREALARRGVTVAGGTRTANWLERQTNALDYARLVELAAVDSRPLAEIVRTMMKPSQNLYAQLLLLQVGVKARKKPETAGQTTEEMGLIEMNKFLAEAGVKKGDVLLEEGSGLSRAALVTPNAIVTLLQFMSRHRHAEFFRDALPVAAVDGTLRHRLHGTVAAKNVRAKTGSLRYVNTLSGYVTTSAGERLAFSLMLNNYAGTTARADLDAIAVQLAGFTGRSF